MKARLPLSPPLTLLAATLATLLLPITPASAAAGAQALDLGPSAPGIVQSVSIYLKVRNPAALDQLIAATVNPTSPQYHQFLSVAKFADNFAPTSQDLNAILDTLTDAGIVINEVYADHLVIRASGTLAQFNAAFNTSIHDFQDADGKTFRQPVQAPTMAVTLQSLVLTVAGLNTNVPQALSHRRTLQEVPASLGAIAPAIRLPATGSTASGVPGIYTVGDVANFYGINPLYQRGVLGQGRTLGIATLANFRPSDAEYYWQSIGLQVKPDRIRQVHVDGGGPLSAAAGSGETALDVEQSGGLAPQANIVVYDAPNTDSGFLDVFYKAVSDNLVDTLSVSWGSPELYYLPTTGSPDLTPQLQAFHQAFAEAAVQGISLFAATGDSGAFDTASGAPAPQYTTPLSVDSPASDPYVVAAGGTTLPASISFTGVASPVVINTEQVWGWDYLSPLFGTDAVFPIGGGGGVSIVWPAPAWQAKFPGVLTSAPQQTWSWYPNFPDLTGGPQLLYTLPAGFAGRNLPDVSLNADPFTGYLVYSTPDGGFQAGYGGTSFVAPQLNGITTLLVQATGSRLGLLQPALYAAQQKRRGIRDIAAGDNWGYSGIPGYEPAAGLGVLNVAKLLTTLQKPD